MSQIMSNITSDGASVCLFLLLLGWPNSKTDFISKGLKYYEVFENFPYQQTDFKIIDSNTMVFSYSQHIKDVRNFEKTEKVDLNSYDGSVRFYKVNGKFIWKIKKRSWTKICVQKFLLSGSLV